MTSSSFHFLKPKFHDCHGRWILISFVAAIFAFCFAFSGRSATYYVDFSSGSDTNNGTSKTTPWKEAPGMSGFSGAYKHHAGDCLIFRGGVSWNNKIAPWIISNGGTAGENDYYGVDETWFSGTNWSRPVFDGGSQYPIAPTEMLGYWSISGSYVTLDNLTLQNIGVSGTNQGNYAIRLLNCHDILVENMHLPVESRIAILLTDSLGTTNGNWEFFSNDISCCSWGIGGGPGTGTVMTNILIHNNIFHDFHDQMADGAHGDGIYLYSTVSNLNTYCDNLRIYDNSFFGDFSKTDASASGMSSFIWSSAQAHGSSYIYNNVMTYTENGSVISYAIGCWGSSVLVSGSSGCIYVFNNSYRADGNSYYFVSAADLSNLVVMNNIYFGGAAAYSLQAQLNTFSSDYNDFQGQSSSVAFFVNYAGFRASGPIAAIFVNNPGFGYTAGSVVSPTYGVGAQATVISTNSSGGVTGLELTAPGFGYTPNYPGTTTLISGTGSGLTVYTTVPVPSGFETHGITNNPLFLSTANLQVESSSPAIGAGTNLSAFFSGDYDGNLRPASGAWELGAYQYVSNTPPPPAGLRAVSP